MQENNFAPVLEEEIVQNPRHLKTYLGNEQIKAHNADMGVEWEDWEVEEYEKCAFDINYFAEKYIKIISLDKGLIPYIPYPYQREMYNVIDNNRFSIVLAPRQSGKALDLNMPILTTDGIKKFGELKQGDYVFGTDGKPTKITFVTETMHDHECFKVCFDDGTEIVADADHLWTVNSSDWNTGQKTLTTKELVPLLKQKKINGSGLRIPIAEPIEFTHQELPIDPYVLGVWLGDGSRWSGTISCHEDDYSHYKKEFEKRNYSVNSFRKKKDSNAGCFSTKTLTKTLRLNNFKFNKHIPSQYLYSSIEQRYELIKGLMDTDGSCDQQGHSEFYQKNKKLIEDFRFILSTLGIKSRVREKEIDGEIYHTVSFRPPMEIYSLERKLTRQRQQLVRPIRRQEKNFYIKDIIQCDSVPVRCIGVEAENKLFLAEKTLIPTHNSLAFVIWLLHYAIFNPSKTIVIGAQNLDTAMEMLARITLALENLPFFLQPGCRSLNKKTVLFSNKSKIYARATGKNTLRGLSVNVLFLDEFAIVEKSEKFYTGAYPTISSGKDTKLIITSTANGVGNQFFNIWDKAIKGRNEYKAFEVKWNDVPGRDAKWREETIANTSERQFMQEFENKFLGGTNTLIDGDTLLRLQSIDPVFQNSNIKVYEKPEKHHQYVITADVSEGVGQDYSAFSIIDVTYRPFKQVAIFSDDKISPYKYSEILVKHAQIYNNAFICVESNDHGSLVNHTIHTELEYENLYSESFTDVAKIGLKTTKKTKRLGCTHFKDLLEGGKLQVFDDQTIQEICRFEERKGTYMAASGCNDDLVMTLVLFGYLASTEKFKNEFDINLKKTVLTPEVLEQIEKQKVVPFGIINDHSETNSKPVIARFTPKERFEKQTTFMIDDVFGVIIEERGPNHEGQNFLL